MSPAYLSRAYVRVKATALASSKRLFVVKGKKPLTTTAFQGGTLETLEETLPHHNLPVSKDDPWKEDGPCKKPRSLLPFTIDRLPLTIHSPFTVHHGKRKTVNVQKTTNSKWLTKSLAILALTVVTSTSLLLAGNTGSTTAATSSYLNFQARLLTTAGNVVPDGNYNVEFKIYDSLASGGSADGVCVGGVTDDCLWLETRETTDKVRVVNGYLTVNLGSVTAFPAIDWDQQLYLTMNIGGTGSPSYDGEMSPRIKLTALPYAFTAGELAKSSGSDRGTLSFGSVTNNPVITLPNETGVVCTTGSICSGYQATGNYFVQGGNSFTAAATLGTNDNFGLNLEVNSTTVASFSNTGAVTFTNSSNGTSAFSIQKATGSDTLLHADTTNNRIIIGNATASAGTDTTLFVIDSGATANLPAGVNGGIVYDSDLDKFKIYEDGQYKILCNETDLACNAPVTVTLQDAYDDSTGSTTPEIKLDSTRGALDIQDANSTIAGNLLNVRASNGAGLGNILFGVGNTGATIFQNSTNSTTAFQIQNAAGGGLFQVDSTNSNLTLNGNNSGETKAWSTNANALSVARYLGGQTTANGYVYIVGGWNSAGNTVNSVLYAKLNADGSIGSWNCQGTTVATSCGVGAVNVTNANALPAVRGSLMTIVVNGYIYAMGGDSGGINVQSTVYHAKLNADGSTGAWSSGVDKSLPALRARSAAVTLNGYIYLLGGYDGSINTDVIYYTKPDASGIISSWTANATNLPAINSHQNTVTDNGYIYMFGGAPGNVVADGRNVSYTKPNADGSISSWTTQTNALPAVKFTGSAAVVNGYVYLYGGDTSGSAAAATGSVYYSKLNANGSTTSPWSTSTNSFPSSAVRTNFNQQGIAANGYIYAIGGVNASSTAQSTVYYTSTARTTIAGSLDLVGITGQNLADGTTGGSLTAGNTEIIGTLNVRGASYFQQAVAVNENFTAGGDVVLNGNNANSTSAGAIQAWRTGNNAGTLSSNPRSNAAQVIANGYIYIIGGGNSGTAQSTVMYAKIKANGDVGNWTTTTALPANRQGASAVVANGYIYVTGGSASAATSNAQRTVLYAKVNPDGTLGSWNTSSNTMPAVRIYHASVALNGYIYTIAGQHEGGSHQLTVYFAKLNADGSTGAWASTTSMSSSTSSNGVTTANGYIYTITGNSSTISYAKPNADGTISSWSGGATPANRAGVQTVISNGYIYVIGGAATIGGSPAYTTTLFAPLNANGSIGNWSCQGPSGDCTGATVINNTALPDIRAVAGTTGLTANGYIYFVGGENSAGTAQSTVYYTSTARTQINGALDLVGNTGENLAEGGSGGELTAGNTNIIGNLNVQGTGRFNQGLAVAGTLTVDGNVSLGSPILSNVNIQTTVNSQSAFQVQNTSASTIAAVSTVSNTQNLITNPSFESNTANWTGLTGSTLTTTSTAAALVHGTQALLATTTASANRGAHYNYNFKANTEYTFSVYAGVASGSPGAFFQLYYTINNVVTTTNCPVTQTLTTTMTKFTCSFNSGGTINAATDGIGMRYTDATTAFNFYFDAAQLEQATAATAFNDQPYPNLIANPDNENTINGWAIHGSGSTVSRSDDFANFGYRSLKLVTGTSTNAGAQFSYQLQANSRYTMSFWAKRDSSSAATYRPGFNPNPPSAGSATNDDNTCSTITITTTWTNFTCTIAVGATVTELSNIWIKQTANTNSNVYIDGVTLVASGVAQSYNPGGANLQVDPLSNTVILNGNSSGELGAWRRGADSLGGNRSDGASITVNGYMYMIGGSTSTSDANAQTTVLYAKLNTDGSNGAWQTSSGNPLPNARTGLRLTTANGYIYAIGGKNTSGTAQTDIYYAKLNADGTTGSWITTSLPQARETHSVAVANGYLYVVGGFSPNARDTILIAKLNADGSLGTWRCQGADITVCGISSTNTNYLPAALGGSLVFAANGYLYSIGGYLVGSVTDSIYYAQLNSDGTTGSWSSQSSNKPAARGGPIGGVMNGYVYFVGGWNGSAVTNTVYYAKLNSVGGTGAWTTSPNTLPVTLNSNGYSISNGYMYSIGGYDGSGTTTSIYYTSGARLQLSGALDLVGLSGQNLSEGGTGGELTAGNTNIIGELGVRGNAAFTQGVSIDKDLRVGGSALFQSASDSTSAFQIQNSAGSRILNINTSTVPNLVSNPDIESNTNGWVLRNAGGSPTMNISEAFANFGRRSLEIVTSTTANNGVEYRFPFKASTQYSLSFWAKRSTSSSTAWSVGRADNGSDSDCTTNPLIGTVGLTTTWTQFTCTFTTDGTIGSSSNFYIKQSDTSTDTIYIDGVTLVQAANHQNYVSPATSLQANVYNQELVLNGGNNGTIQNWRAGNNTGFAGQSSHAAVIANGHAYIMGGLNSGSTPQTTVQYAKIQADGNFGTWATLSGTPLPAARVEPSAVFANGFIYVTGGSTNDTSANATDTVYYAKVNADGTLGAWQTGSPINVSGSQTRWGHNSVAYNGYLYVIGGLNASGTAQSTVYYSKLNADGSNGSWASTNTTPSQTIGGAAVANGYVYVTRAFGTAVVYYAKLNADGTTGSWSSATSLPGNREDGAVSISNGYIYYIGGDNGSTVTSTTYFALLKADGRIGSWSCQGSVSECSVTPINDVALPNGRRHFGKTPMVANGYMYVIGGWNSGGVGLTTIYYTSTSRTQIGGSLDLVGLSGQNLSEGGTGGELTAGNTNIIGSLQLQGSATFAQSLSVDKELTVGGSTLFKNSSNSTSAYQFQNSSGVTILGINTTSGILFSNIANGSSAIGFTLNTNNTYSTAGAKLISIQNNTTEKFAVDKNGNILVVTGANLAFQGVGLTQNAVTKWFNCAGIPLAYADVVSVDAADGSTVNFPATGDDPLVVGTVLQKSSDACEVAIGGIVEVRVDNSNPINVGDLLSTEIGSGEAIDNGTTATGLVFAKALEDAVGANDVIWVRLWH